MSNDRIVSDTARKKIHVSELRIGMYVSQLDRDWLDTPFVMQGFLVETMDDIAVVEKYCEHVWIDTVEEYRAGGHSLQQHSPRPKRVRYINKVSTTDEQRKAIGVYREARRITKHLLDEVRLGAVVNTASAKETVNECVKSILRNADALLWMAKIRQEDEYTAEHCLNVCILAIAFGRQLGLSELELHNLGLCGLLHDVGKMRVPHEILNKPEKLTDKEFKLIKAHTVHGRNLLLAAPGGYDGIVDVAYSHHEKIDGTGYPRKLKGAGISQFSKIIALVDAFDAMTANRCYARAMTPTAALRNIYHDRGTHFDERLALVFIKTIGLYPPGSVVELKSGEVGLVFSTNTKYRHLPKVLMVLDNQKQPRKPQVLDLALVEKKELSADHLIAHVHCDGEFGIFIKDFREQGLQLSHG